MTSPANSIKRAGSRFYVDPITGDKLPSVTSIQNALSKPALQFWAAKMVAQCAVEEFGAVSQMIIGGNPDNAIDYLKRAPGRSSGKAAGLGTEIHDLADRIGKGEVLERVHPDHQGFVDQLHKFIKDFDVSFLESEATVWSDTHGFAGTLDAIVLIDGEAIILDYKTGASGIWPDVGIQLNAYANADEILDKSGERRPLPKIDGAAALHLRPDSYELIPVRLGDDIFDVFQALTVASHWVRDLSKTVLGNPVDPTQKEKQNAIK